MLAVQLQAEMSSGPLGLSHGTPVLLLDTSVLYMQILQQHGYGAAIDTKEWRRRPAFIQSFEVDNLKWLSKHTAIPLLQLLEDAHLRTADTNQSYGELMSDAGLAAISEYASGIGPWKGVMVPADGTGEHASTSHPQCNDTHFR